MCVEPFGLGHGRDCGRQRVEPVARQLLECDLAHETVDVHPAAGTGPAARGQRVEPVSEVQELNENVSDENSEPTESECENFEEDEEMGMEMSM